ncbi:Crp/Fnr family transcriptional regulator [Dyadobacter tibetensis]|uniref:Crp/Fnr family transcriptional regulator n=1 Tax=Dyadobacter tibetensis TaxID=1211851 RepID=UPI00046EC42A|nr:Crp/Fnr family transcriptional regulator [Dyadobacter tibetensis]
MEAIRKYFERSVRQSEEDWAIFSSKLSPYKVQKGENLLATGQTEKYLSFIETGMLRFYSMYSLEEKTFGFAFAGSFVSAYDSFLTQKPAAYSIQALADSELWRVSYEDLQIIYRETQVGERIGRLASEALYLTKSKRELSLLYESAESRYLNLFAEQPHLLQNIPLKYIASYIGVTPQALSRIRKRIT